MGLGVHIEVHKSALGKNAVEKCSSDMNFLHKFWCECVGSGSRHFIGNHFEKLVTNFML
jgi:hypothetical protein